MSLVCSVIFIHHAFNANILDKDYAFSDGEILMVDNAVRTHFEPYERHFKEIGFTENTIKKYLQCTKEGANKRGNSSRLTQSFHFFMFEPIFSPVNALNQPI
ncbi:Putative ARAC-type regulatory protein [Escherichia coli]|nr:Putative ARAC-type regulatory protein [Escherichia coli]SQY99964.1 Putative ARAC-type regulatory protein [Escherichia coli]